MESKLEESLKFLEKYRQLCLEHKKIVEADYVFSEVREDYILKVCAQMEHNMRQAFTR